MYKIFKDLIGSNVRGRYQQQEGDTSNRRAMPPVHHLENNRKMRKTPVQNIYQGDSLFMSESFLRPNVLDWFLI